MSYDMVDAPIWSDFNVHARLSGVCTILNFYCTLQAYELQKVNYDDVKKELEVLKEKVKVS